MEFPELSTKELIEQFLRDDVYYNTSGSNIVNFFNGKSIFLTGGTGFLGKLLIEKLLRACPGIEFIFLLVRSKKGKSYHTRIDEILNDVLFEKVRKLQPNIEKKIILIDGDISLPGLGISMTHRELFKDKATIFIHSAATVQFQANLHKAVGLNIKGTIEMIKLAKECKHVDAFVYIGTAYSFCTEPDKTVNEILYDVPYGADQIMTLCKILPPGCLEQATPKLLHKWRNTYVFTKAIAEHCVKRYASDLPVCIFRPAIVAATYKEPLKGWANKIFGIVGISVGCGLGVLRVLRMDGHAIANIVPGDMVTNCLLAATYKTAIDRKQEMPIYNFTNYSRQKLTWKDYRHSQMKYYEKTPAMGGMWKPSLALIPNYYLFYLYMFFVHFVPGAIIDVVLSLINKKPRLINLYKKLNDTSGDFHYLGGGHFNFVHKNVDNLYDELSEEDKKLFYFDMRNFDWVEYLSTLVLGLRTYVGKQDISSIPQGVKRHTMFKIAHYGLLITLFAMFLIAVYKMFFCLSFLRIV